MNTSSAFVFMEAADGIEPPYKAGSLRLSTRPHGKIFMAGTASAERIRGCVKSKK